MRRVLLVCFGALLLSAAIASAATWSAARSPRAAAVVPSTVVSHGVEPVTSERVARRSRVSRSTRRPLLFGLRSAKHSQRAKIGAFGKAFSFTAHATGMASAIHVYVRPHSRARRLVVGVYSNLAGRPDFLLASGSQRAPRAGAWNAIQIPRTQVRSGAIYWVAVAGRGGRLYVRSARARCRARTVFESASRSLPGTWRRGRRLSRCPILVYASGTRSKFQSVVFWLAWDGGRLSSLPWDAVTQVNLFSLATCVRAGDPAPDCSGPASISHDYNSVRNVASFVNTVHRHGKLAIITIGGSTNPNWNYPCQSANVDRFAHNLVNYMQSNRFDGIDLDIEQDPGGLADRSFSKSELTNCVRTVVDDAKAVKTVQGARPLVTADVDPTTDFDIGADEAPYIDQFNAMSYGAIGSTLASEIKALESKSHIRASKITEGVDIEDDPATLSDCGNNASWAASKRLAGAMLWFGQADAPRYRCLGAVAPYLQ